MSPEKFVQPHDALFSITAEALFSSIAAALEKTFIKNSIILREMHQNQSRQLESSQPLSYVHYVHKTPEASFCTIRLSLLCSKKYLDQETK